ncbi:hypothetical protein SAMN05192588_2516 [Nonlabens sp. Hel1_33_55]|uniref:hypothetical protein n=1 Tax=Nonlabens sp. Hel1_33_55 TaxID=1336802 RepID=UPI000875C7D9|nr:hypothetical protein [Nonlabens sp. Hel1_33_55]SCY36793.1 hypothetical protein SAMN05192588_2516 [Nonlabens sp. Hel1_33_55]
MPVNLNALIRYKTIDKCLRNTLVSSDMQYLIKQCSTALNEATGKKGGVSERTIRNDLRVLRSDILSFNAPIVVKNGVYKYSDKNFSIFETSFSEMELLIEIQGLLVDEFHNISNRNLPVLLSRLNSITNIEVAKEFLPKPLNDSKPKILPKRVSTEASSYASKLNLYFKKIDQKRGFWKKSKPKGLKWEFVFDVLMNNI